MSHKEVTELCLLVKNIVWINLCLTLASASPIPTLGCAHQQVTRVLPSSHFKNELEEEEESVNMLAGWKNRWGSRGKLPREGEP